MYYSEGKWHKIGWDMDFFILEGLNDKLMLIFEEENDIMKSQ